jgi:hypothetical protein
MAGGASTFGLSTDCGFSGLGSYKPDAFAYSSNHLVCVQFFGHVVVHMVSLSSLRSSFPHQRASQSYTRQSVSALWVGSLRGGLTSRSRRTASPPLNSSVRRLRHISFGESVEHSWWLIASSRVPCVACRKQCCSCALLIVLACVGQPLFPWASSRALRQLNWSASSSYS